nr:15033_t:CDS:2 [Entrophospora candida]
MKIYENLYEILSDSEPEPSGESLLNINREESEINLIFSQEDNEITRSNPWSINPVHLTRVGLG